MVAEPQETSQQPHPQWVGVSHADCDKMLQHALNRDPTVKFMVEKLKEVQLLPLQGNHIWQALSRATMAYSHAQRRLASVLCHYPTGF